MINEKLLKKFLNIGITISVAIFALSYVMSIFEYKSFSSFTSLLATFMLVFTPLAVVLAIAVEMARKKDFNGLFMSVLVIVVIAISIVMAYLK
ncbi:MAG: hypothetical protein QW701_06605 [Candidatus Nezhaarchaeales archaeon]